PHTRRFSFRLDRELRLVAVFEPVAFAPVPHCSVNLYSHSSANYPHWRVFQEIGRDAFDRAFDSSLTSLVAELGRPESEGEHGIGWVKPPAGVEVPHDRG